MVTSTWSQGDIDILECAENAVNLISGLQGKSHYKKLEELGLILLVKI